MFLTKQTTVISSLLQPLFSAVDLFYSRNVGVNWDNIKFFSCCCNNRLFSKRPSFSICSLEHLTKLHCMMGETCLSHPFPEFVGGAAPGGERPRLYMSESVYQPAPSWWRVFLRSPRSGSPRPWRPRHWCHHHPWNMRERRLAKYMQC